MTQVGWGTFYEMGKGVPVRQSDCQTVRQTPAAHSSRGKDCPKRVFTLDGELLQDLGLKSMFFYPPIHLSGLGSILDGFS